MARLLFLLFCASCAWLVAPAASAASVRHRPLPGDHRPNYTYYRGSGSPHRSFFSMFQHRSGRHKVRPHGVRRHRGTR